MPNLTVKNIPADLYALLKESATANRRSINNEIITCIAQSVYGRKTNPEDALIRARQLRQKTLRYPITDRKFITAKRTGRL
jgi:hypothetical protein